MRRCSRRASGDPCGDPAGPASPPRPRPSTGNQPILVVDGVQINEADSGRVRAIREQLQAVLERHLAAEDSMRSLEIADVERRLAQVREETARRRRDRAALVRQMVDEVLRDARRPE